MIKDGKKLSISELRTIYRKYKEKDPEKINNLRSQIVFHSETLSVLFDQYVDSTCSLNRLIVNVAISNNTQEKIKGIIYGLIDYIILSYEAYDKCKSDFDRIQLDLDCNRYLKIGYYNEILLLEENNIYTIIDFYRSVIDRSIFNIMDNKTILTFLIIINNFCKKYNIMQTPELIYKEITKMKKEIEQSDCNFISLCNIEDYHSNVSCSKGLFQITFVLLSKLTLPSETYHDVFVILNPIKCTYKIVGESNYISSMFDSETEFKNCIKDAILKFFNFKNHRVLNREYTKVDIREEDDNNEQ